jgi:hypothetical protein
MFKLYTLLSTFFRLIIQSIVTSEVKVRNSDLVVAVLTEDWNSIVKYFYSEILGLMIFLIR